MIMMSTHRKQTMALACMIGLLLVTSALVWYDLGVREVLGRDENLTIVKVDQPDFLSALRAASIKATGKQGNMPPLYFLAQNLLWPLLERSAFMLRFLSSVCTVLTVAFTYKLSSTPFRSFSSPGAAKAIGVIAAMLTVLLELTISYAQIARPYAQLAMLSMASACFLLQAFKTNRTIHWAGFVLVSTLNVYTHYYALLVLAAEGLFAATLWGSELITIIKEKQSARKLIGPALSFLLVGVLCLPGLLRLAQLPWVGRKGDVQVQLTISFFYRLAYKIGLTSAWLRGLVVSLMAIGLFATIRQRLWNSALFCLLWLGIPLGVLAIVKTPRPFSERYVIFLPPVAFLLAATGVVALAQLLSYPVPRRHRQIVRWIVTLILAAGTALSFAMPLQTYYASNRSEHRLDITLEIVERNAQAGDLIIVSPRFFVRPLNVRGADVRYLTEHPRYDQFEEILSTYARVWILFTSYLPSAELQGPMDQWIQERSGECARVPIKAITALAYCNQEPRDTVEFWQDRIAILQELAEASADNQEAWLRYEELATAYESLSLLYANQGETTLAKQYQSKANEAREAGPPAG